MLSRGNSIASNRLRRAKSSSLTQTAHHTVIEPKTIDPAIARQQALAAAAHAFERASERTVVTPEIKRQWQKLAPLPGAENEQGLVRKQSVRFTGPNAVHIRDIQITRRIVPNDTAKIDSLDDEVHPPEGIESHEDEVHAPQASDEYGPRPSESFTVQLATMQDLGLRSPSMPSSYPKLRKAKSMFNPRNHRPMIFTNGPLKKESQVNQLLPTPGSHLRKSDSFTRGGSDNMSANADQSTIPDTAIQIARDQFFHQLEHQRLNDQSSYVALSKHEKPQKAFRKTVRTSSTNSQGSAVASTAPYSVEPIVKRRFGHKARSLSLSLRNKIMRVFQRPSDIEEAIPVQQIDASRPHFGDYISTSSGIDQQYHPVPSPDDEIVKKVMSRESLFCDVPKFLDKPSNPGSIRSIRSDDEVSNTKSRVTSWTNSTAANTMTSQLQERKRLSIIQENGSPYQPSSSSRHYGDLGTLFHQPGRSNSVGTRAGNVVDSQRIYDALQRRIDESKHTAQSEGSDTATENGAERVRNLPSNTDRVSLSSRTMANTSTDSLDQRRKIRMWKSTNFRPSTTVSIGNGPNQVKKGFVDQTHPQNFFEMRTGLTPQQIAERNESGTPSPKRPLREVKSTFFPSSTRIERSNTSPYRRAMKSSSEDENGIDPAVEALGHDPHFRRITPSRIHVRSIIGTESVYSRGSSGDTPRAGKSSLSLPTSAGSAEAGTAVVITTRAGRYEQSLSPLARRSISSFRSSENWQQWMASQVAPLEACGDENRRVSDTKSFNENGHKRERAQIDGDDVRIGNVKAYIQSPKQPLGIIQEKAISRPVQNHQKSHPMNDRFPILGNGQPAQSNTLNQSPSTPKSHHATPIRRLAQGDYEKYSSGRKSNASTENSLKKSYTSTESPSGTSKLRRKQVTTDSENLDIHKADGPHPAYSRLRGLPAELRQMDKFQSRNSPERIARLRRMQTKSSHSLGSEGTPKCDSEFGLNRFHLQEKKQNISSPTTPAKGNSDNFSSSEAIGAAGMCGPVEVHSSGGGRRLVDIFLSNRRRQMRISEESENQATDPAFL